VGEEEDSVIEIGGRGPYSVNAMVVPDYLRGLVDAKAEEMHAVRRRLDANAFQDLVAFIDPIDGTKEFINGRGEQCTICLGFSDSNTGEAVAGVVYRPITGTWAAGASSESYRVSKLAPDGDGSSFLASSGALSAFTQTAQRELGRDLGLELRLCGGAGNKVLNFLVKKGACYIQDRGLSRWDTCACEAVLTAFGGRLLLLDTILEGCLQP